MVKEIAQMATMRGIADLRRNDNLIKSKDTDFPGTVSIKMKWKSLQKLWFPGVIDLRIFTTLATATGAGWRRISTKMGNSLSHWSCPRRRTCLRSTWSAWAGRTGSVWLRSRRCTPQRDQWTFTAKDPLKWEGRNLWNHKHFNFSECIGKKILLFNFGLPIARTNISDIRVCRPCDTAMNLSIFRYSTFYIWTTCIHNTHKLVLSCSEKKNSCDACARGRSSTVSITHEYCMTAAY